MKKVRITITLDSSLLDFLDSIVREKSIKAIRLGRKPMSRSQVIEDLIRDSLTKKE